MSAEERASKRATDLEDLNKHWKVESGELVLAGNVGGVLAYEKAALEDRGSVLTTNGVQTMTADELKKLLGR